MKKFAFILFALSLTSCWYSFEKKVSLDKTFTPGYNDSTGVFKDSTDTPDSIVMKTEYVINGFKTTTYMTYTEDGKNKKSHLRKVVTKVDDTVHTIKQNQTDLINLAFYDADATVRKQALTLLNDENSIQHVAFFDEDAEVRMLAVTMLKEESNLQHVAFFDQDEKVRMLAVTLLKAQSNIQHVAFFDEVVSVRKVALGKLTERKDIQHVATFDDNNEIRKTAFKMLSRQNLK